MRLSRLASLTVIALSFNVLPLTLPNRSANPLLAAAMAQSAENQLIQADRLLQETGSLYEAGRYSEAIQQLQQALEIYRNDETRQAYPQESRIGEVAVLNNLGLIRGALGEHEQEIDYYQQALPIARSIGDRSGEAKLLNNLGTAYGSLDQLQQSTDYFKQALAIYQTLDDRSGEADTLMNLGLNAGSLGQYESAVEYFQTALPIFQAIGEPNQAGIVLAALGRLYVVQNNPIAAIEQLQKSVEVRESIRAELRDLPPADQQAYVSYIAEDYQFLAELLRQQNRNQEAQAVLDLL